MCDSRQPLQAAAGNLCRQQPATFADKRGSPFRGIHINGGGEYPPRKDFPGGALRAVRHARSRAHEAGGVGDGWQRVGSDGGTGGGVGSLARRRASYGPPRAPGAARRPAMAGGSGVAWHRCRAPARVRPPARRLRAPLGPGGRAGARRARRQARPAAAAPVPPASTARGAAPAGVPATELVDRQELAVDRQELAVDRQELAGPAEGTARHRRAAAEVGRAGRRCARG